MSPGGMPASHLCHLNPKLHKRKPSQSVLPSAPRPPWTPPESTPPYQEPPGSSLPLTWAPFTAAFSKGRPPSPSSGQHPPEGGTPSSRNLFRRLPRGPPWRISGLFSGLCQTPPFRGPFPEPPPRPQSGLPAADSGTVPFLPDVPSPRTSPPAPRPQGLPGTQRLGCGADLLQLPGPIERGGGSGGATPL